MKQLLFFLILSCSSAAFAQTADQDSLILDEKFIRQNLIGEWRDQNSITIYKKNGTYTTTFDSGMAEYGNNN